MSGRITTEMDAPGSNCPLPILRIKMVLAGIKPGVMVRISATDPGSIMKFNHCPAKLEIGSSLPVISKVLSCVLFVKAEETR